ncbi:hypothetical protein FVE85_1850 [Porphyridium purpureum]|uniref:Uncharacterized protein n=1 Tax=Porphyridium purpureum TaxID=35688 RepID=A0A5J4YWY8_PORPP|nr:hypothetical protein FVE85_1850 [Porphyridium purpureum]|eukprot:POR3602..scf209_3
MAKGLKQLRGAQLGLVLVPVLVLLVAAPALASAQEDGYVDEFVDMQASTCLADETGRCATDEWNVDRTVHEVKRDVKEKAGKVKEMSQQAYGEFADKGKQAYDEYAGKGKQAYDEYVEKGKQAYDEIVPSIQEGVSGLSTKVRDSTHPHWANVKNWWKHQGGQYGRRLEKGFGHHSKTWSEKARVLKGKCSQHLHRMGDKMRKIRLFKKPSLWKQVKKSMMKASVRTRSFFRKFSFA